MQSDSKGSIDSAETDKEILATARKRFKLAAESESENRREALEDLRFMIGQQWPDDVMRARNEDKRPCLTINRIPQFVRQITNDQRQNRPSIKINPVDDKADVETAKIFQGVVRHIEYASHAEIAYDTATEAQVGTGLGFFRLMTGYSDPMSFQQEIMIKSIKDRFSVYVDPFYQEPDGSDMEWGFIIEDMSADEFKAQYPDAQLSSMSDWESVGSMSAGWVQRDLARVAEYYYKVYEKEDIVLLSDKRVLTKSDYEKIADGFPETVRVVSERTTLVPKVKWCKINGVEILERTDVPGEWIPIIPVVGEESIVDGKKVQSGIIRHVKDPQRMYNYWASSETETIALAPRAPFIGYAGQFEGFEEQWKTANTKNHAFLQVKPTHIGGQPAPLPQRTVWEPAVQAITAARGQAADDMKATTGIYDATLGNRSNEQSGVAIQRRNSQSQTSNFHFMDNLSRSLRHAGRIMLCWIPKVYDTAQAIRVIGEDGEVDMIQINQIFEENGEEKSFFLDHGRFDTTVDTGPSYATKRQEAVADMLDLTRSVPQAMQLALDLMVRNMDWPGASEIADRIKKSLPPNITADDKDAAQVPPQIQQQLQHMGQMVQQLSQQNSEYIETIKSKNLELASRERIAAMQAQTQLNIEYMKHHAKDSQLQYETEIDLINKRMDLLGEDQPVDPSQPMNNGAGGQSAAPPQYQQPTGGQQSPGLPTGV